jgi:hypothetical protein
VANGEEDVEYEFEGNPECEVCGGLAGMTDSRPIPPPHENCQCTNAATCNNRYSVTGSSTRYGPDNNCFIFNAEVTVICWDGTEIGASIPIDFGCVGSGGEDFFDLMYEATADEAASMADGCPDCAPPLVS